MSTSATARLARIGLPSFGEPTVRPELPAARYPERIEALRARMSARGYDRLVVFADREHSASISFLTGFDIEDGTALGDAALREAFAAAYPEAWSRIEARRAFMADMLGIALHEDVLPFSNLPAYLSPFLLGPDRAMTMAPR